jgi:hypothetical protein
MLIGGRIASFRIGQCEFRDSINILPVALAQYQKTEIDYSIFEKAEREKAENKAEIEDYLRDDCIDLYNFIKTFIDGYGVQITQATAAIRQWQKIEKIKAPRSEREYYEEYSQFYYGGRVECFARGVSDSRFFVADINSAYPRAMLEKHPFNLSAYDDHATLDRIVGSSFVKLRCISAGALPFKNANGSLSFPRDNQLRDFCASGWEILAALRTGTIRNVELIRVVNFRETIDFSEYILKFYQARLECKALGDKAGDIINKLLMNSLYGKFGANPSRYKKYVIVDPDDFAKGEIIDFDDDDFKVTGELGPWLLASRPLDDLEARYYDVCTGASITGYVRAFLWESICKVGIENVLYCDTDSIAALAGLEKLDTGKQLGQWKHEGDFDRYAIGGKKMYAFRSVDGSYKTAAKGAKLSPRDIENVALGQTVVYSPDVPTFSAHRKPGFTPRIIRQTGI